MVAMHKHSALPDDPGYFPVQVGKDLSEFSLPVTGDNTGENISFLNDSFCELTGLYWLWKNCDAEFFGLTHYRRYFKPSGEACDEIKGVRIASASDLCKHLDQYDVILPAKRYYIIDTVRQHYSGAHRVSDLNLTEKVIGDLYPEYSNSFTHVMNQRSLSLFNMFVMRRALFNDYCEWLFTILFEVKARMPTGSNEGAYQKRVFGFLAERLLNVWIHRRVSPDKTKYIPVVNIEGQGLLRLGIKYLYRKMSGNKRP